MKLLFAEDTVDLSRAVTALLEREGYYVDAVYDGRQALEHIKSESYDGIILDIMMPEKDGLEVLKEIRGMRIITPVLMLTAKSEVDDKVTGLELGADDYLTKPFAIKELIARVKAMTRRYTKYSGDSLKFGDITLESDSFELSSKNAVRLSVKEFELLQSLIVNSNTAVDDRFFLDPVWNDEPDATDDTVNLYIMYLKGKLKAIGSNTEITKDEDGNYKITYNGK